MGPETLHFLKIFFKRFILFEKKGECLGTRVGGGAGRENLKTDSPLSSESDAGLDLWILRS